MARPATIWFSADRGGYFTGYKGLKRRLFSCDVDDRPHGPNYRQAEAAFDALRARLEEPDPRDQTFGIALERWLRKLAQGNEHTATTCRSLLRDLGNRIGHLDVSEVSAKQLREYVQTRQEWGESTKALAVSRLKACLRWNVEQGYCTFNPLEKMKGNGGYDVAVRGEEYVLPPALSALLLKDGNEAWRDLLLALSLTGARPGELASAERRHYRPGEKIIVLTEWKNAKKLKRKDKRRIIHLADQVDELVRRNLRRGDLCFPNTEGNPWRVQALSRRLKERLAKKRISEWMRDNNHDEWRVIPYSFRHTYATNAILNNVSPMLLADMMGTSVGVIQSNYSHALANVAGMRNAYLRSIGQEPPAQ